MVEKFCEEDEEEVECRQYTVTLFLSSGGIIDSVERRRCIIYPAAEEAT